MQDHQVNESAVIMFDLDGVIANTWDLFFKHWSQTLKQAGYPQFEEEALFLKLFEGNFFEGLKKETEGADNLSGLLGQAHQAHKDFMQQAELYPDVKETLLVLSEQYCLYLVTSNFASAAEIFLEKHSIECFTQVLGLEHGLSKVDKFRKVVDQCPGRAFYFVSDTLGDLREAHQVGIRPIGVTWGWHDRSLLEQGKPAAIVDHADALLDYLQSTKTL